MIAEPLRALAVPLADLVLDPANARRHPDRNLATIEASLRLYGQRKPVVVRRDGMVVEAGNGTVVAARNLGWTHIAAVIVDDDPVTAAGFGIADNRSAELAEWDDGALASLLSSLQEAEVDIGELGWDPSEIEALISAEPVVGEDPGPSEPPPDPVSRRGELYLLGPHRLLCGDATDPGDVALVMGGEPVESVVTSPPYWRAMAYDVQVDLAEVRAFMAATVETWSSIPTRRFIVDTGDTCASSATGGRGRAGEKWLLDHEWVDAFSAVGWSLRHRRYWVRPGVAKPFAPHLDIVDSSVEAILTFYRRDAEWIGQERVGESWATAGYWDDVVPDRETEGHPCSFPVELARRMMIPFVSPGAVVADPFCGSGTTLITAARTGRRCFALEIAPAYCDVIRKRWGDYARSAGLAPGPGAL